jgi:hypothetical protein
MQNSAVKKIRVYPNMIGNASDIEESIDQF